MKLQKISNRRKCDVLLIHPPWFRLQNSTLIPYPTGPCHIAGALEAAGIDVLVWNGDFDLNNSISIGGTNILKTDELTKAHKSYLSRLNNLEDPLWKEAMEIVEITSPKVIGLSAYSASFKSATNIAKIVKKKYPEISIVIGGLHASIDPEYCLNTCSDIDIAVTGEGESVSPPLFSALLKGRADYNELKKLGGIVFRNNGEIVRTEPGEVIEDLDSLPLPARHLLIDIDRMPPHAHQAIYGFRGCPFKCIFCGSFNVFGRNPRMRSAASLADEIEYVYKTYGTRYFYICDDIFLLKKQRALEFCSLMKQKNIPVYYSVQSRGEMLCEDVLKELKKTGCQHIAIGVEVGDDGIRNLIKKGNTVDDMRKASKLISKAGLRMVGFFMFGFPWETKEQMLKTAELMEEINPCIAFPYIVTPAPGTELWDIAQGMGIIGSNMDFSSFHHESPEMGLTVNIPEEERRVFIDEILERFARHNRKSLQGDIFRRPLFYWSAASDAGIMSSPKNFLKYLRMLIS